MQTIQGMKAVHQFVIDGSWKAAWPLTIIEDPIEGNNLGVTEGELEAILGMLRVKDDLVKIEEKLVSFGPRFTFLETPEMRNMAKNEDFDARAQKKAEKKLDKVEKAVRAADAKAAKEKEAQ